MVQIEATPTMLVDVSKKKKTLNDDDHDHDPFDISMMMSPWNQSSPFAKSPWSDDHRLSSDPLHIDGGLLLGSLVREEGHVYSLAAANGVLFTGSDSKNIRVWKNMQELSAFKSNSGLVKAIVVSGDTIFTGHQDGKVRAWSATNYKRLATLPTFFDLFKASIRPKNYVEVKRNRTALWIRHTDVVSSLSIDHAGGLLYSASWDRTFKVWRLSNSKCLESVRAHDDAVNSVVSSLGGIVYTGSADGTVKVWRREQQGKAFRHVLHRNLYRQESAITALAVAEEGTVLYSASSEGLVNFWEGEKHGGVLKGHKLAVLCLEAAGNLVFSGSADKTICVWRREAEGGLHTCLAVLAGHAGPVKCLAVEEEGEGDGKWKVYSGSLDKSVKVWSVRDHEDSSTWESFT